jgi:hypothetical protein
MCDRPHDKAVRSPWTEGAWLMRLGDVPAGWLWRGGAGAWEHVNPHLFPTFADDIVEAKP